MMMIFGGIVYYKFMFDVGFQIIVKEGVKFFFKGVGVNIFCGVVGVGVLFFYDKVQEFMFGKVYFVSDLLYFCCVLLIVVKGWFWINDWLN